MGLAGGDTDHATPVVAQGALVCQVERPVVGRFLRNEFAGLVRACGRAEGDESVFLG